MKRLYTIYNSDTNIVGWCEEIDDNLVSVRLEEINDGTANYAATDKLCTQPYEITVFNPEAGEFSEGASL
ncbi:hypothetical protein [Flavobacterium coralii]|uniref:hypothetical protein n=1 Tax=Flavobacterium coralii TaxID=2838017 RepID=UPI000C4BE586|nr:hypothetical protein [Flavobacterium sp.]|tara:strand:+ start:219 stop:428 length:210 start_codon:yes stop_codon:yes gene_type:complete